MYIEDYIELTMEFHSLLIISVYLWMAGRQAGRHQERGYEEAALSKVTALNVTEQ